MMKQPTSLRDKWKTNQKIVMSAPRLGDVIKTYTHWISSGPFISCREQTSFEMDEEDEEEE